MIPTAKMPKLNKQNKKKRTCAVPHSRSLCDTQSWYEPNGFALMDRIDIFINVSKRYSGISRQRPVVLASFANKKEKKTKSNQIR